IPPFLRSAFAVQRRHATLFILFALPLGITLVALVPLGQVPDEPSHAMRATSLWRGALIADISIFIAARTEFPDGASKVTQSTLRAARAMRWQTPPLFVSIGP